MGEGQYFTKANKRSLLEETVMKKSIGSTVLNSEN